MTLDIIIPAWNAESTIRHLLSSIDEQASRENIVTVWVIDDASTDSTHKIVNNYLPVNYKLNLIRLETNRGRAAARNVGAKSGTSEALLFIDADCFFEKPDCLQKLVDSYGNGKQVCFGRLEDEADDFWADYFNKAQLRKSLDNLESFSTAFMLCSRKIFIEANGYCEQYTHYGFEDRDLVLRILSNMNTKTKIDYIEDAVLSHNGRDSLTTYCQKQFESGKYSSAIFSKRFPSYYRQMTYSNFDFLECSKTKIYLLNTLSLVRPALTVFFSKLLDTKIAPNNFKVVLAQIVAAISYYEGTRQRETTKPE